MAAPSKTGNIGAAGAAAAVALYAASSWNPLMNESRFGFRRELDIVCVNSHAVLETGQTASSEFATMGLSEPMSECPASSGVTGVTSSVRIKYRQGGQVVFSPWTTANGTTARQDVPKGSGIAVCGQVKYSTKSGPVQKSWYFTADGTEEFTATCNW
jgi:hypothetical protein